MQLIDLLEFPNAQCNNVEVVSEDRRVLLSEYNGKDSIRKIFNHCQVKDWDLNPHKNSLVIYIDDAIELVEGDHITAYGEDVQVGEILYQHIDLGSKCLKPSADVEFRDTKGNYRHWQSWSDGGRIDNIYAQTFDFEDYKEEANV